MEREHLDEISRSGVLAPSADNGLSFGFSYDGATTNVWSNDEEFAPSSQRHRQILSLLAFGAIVENMLLRAQELGFDGLPYWFPSKFQSSWVARIEWSPRTTQTLEDLGQSIATRETNRHFYFGGGPTSAQKAVMSDEVGKIAGARLLWLEGKSRREVLGLVWRAESERFLRRALHQELFGSIRFDLDWRESTDRGLPPAALEVERPMRPLFKALRHWPLMRTLGFIGAHRMLGLRAGLFPCWQAPALGVLSTSLALRPGAVAVGRGLERMWLRATSEKLVMQPMAASTVLALQSNVGEGASPSTRAALVRGWRNIVGDETALMVFRMGSATGTAAPSTKTLRKPLSAYFRAP